MCSHIRWSAGNWATARLTWLRNSSPRPPMSTMMLNLEYLMLLCPVFVIDCHEGHAEPHETSVLPHDPFGIFANSLLLVLTETAEDVGRFLQRRPCDPAFLKLVAKVCNGREHAASGSIVLHYFLEPGRDAGRILPIGNQVRHERSPDEATSFLPFSCADALLGEVGRRPVNQSLALSLTSVSCPVNLGIPILVPAMSSSDSTAAGDVGGGGSGSLSLLELLPLSPLPFSVSSLS